MPPSPPEDDDPPPEELPDDDPPPEDDDEPPEELDEPEAPEEPPEDDEELPEDAPDPPLLLPQAGAQQRSRPRTEAPTRCRIVYPSVGRRAAGASCVMLYERTVPCTTRGAR